LAIWALPITGKKYFVLYLRQPGFSGSQTKNISYFNFPDATYTIPHGLNNDGQIVGYYYDASGSPHSFIESSGAYSEFNVPGAVNTYAYGTNDDGEIVGEFWDGNAYFGFLATPAGPRPHRRAPGMPPLSPQGLEPTPASPS
jgi:uncharacterized membrane protein